MATKSTTRRRWRLAALAVCAAVVVGARVWTGRTEAWQERLANAHDDEAASVAGQIAALGDRGVALLVAALDAPRSSVAAAAREALLAELGRWQRLSPAKARAKADLLSAALAERVEHFGPAARAAAADLALHLLLRRGLDPTADREQLVTRCEQVLRTARPMRHPSNGGQTAAGSRSPALPPAPPLARADRRAIGTAAPGAFLADATAPMASTAEPDGTFERADGADDGSRTVLTSATAPVESIEDADAVDLFAQLHADKEIADAAREELQAREFTTEEIELGAHLTSSSAAERRRWAATLARSGGNGARQWFVWLKDDVDDEVRQVAVTWLATH